VTEPRTPAHWPPDSELNAKLVVVVGLGLLLSIALAAAVAWWLAVALRGGLEAQDPPPPVLIEAQSAYEPPTPRLEIDPAVQLRQLHAEEDETLGSYGWVDEAGGVARVPIERGMELLLETRADGRAFGEATPESDDPTVRAVAGDTQ